MCVNRFVPQTDKEIGARRSQKNSEHSDSLWCNKRGVAYSAVLKRSLNCSTLTVFSSTVTAFLTAAHIIESTT